MDMVTGLPLTPRGHDSFILFICRLTKLIHVAPTTKTVTAEGVARLYFDNVWRLHGWPAEIVSDRDPRFTSDFWSALTSITGTKLNMSTPDHPQTDGQAENGNKIILAGLRHYVDSFQDNWDLYLTPVEFAHNDAAQASTGFSPFFLTYGFHPPTPAALAADAPSTRPSNTSAFVKHMKTYLQRARAALTNAQAAQAQAANRHRRHVTLPVGSFAWLSAHHLHPPSAPTARRKLSPRFFGPYKVLEALSDVTYRLDLPAHFRRHPTIHISHLKPYHGSAAPQAIRNPPPPDIVDGEKHYHVEAFLSSRRSGSRKQFLVKWTGCPADENEYVSATTLQEDLDPDTFDRLQAAMNERLRRSPRRGTATS
jgi:hypothetical protein